MRDGRVRHASINNDENAHGMIEKNEVTMLITSQDVNSYVNKNNTQVTLNAPRVSLV